MTIGIQVLDLTVVCPFVRDIEGGCNGTTVRVHSALFKEVVVQPFIQIIHRVVESEENDLRYLFHRQVACWLVGIAKQREKSSVRNIVAERKQKRVK